MSENALTPNLPAGREQRALRILAKSVYRELKASGYERSAIVGFTSELLDLVTSELRDGEPGPLA